jgi:hypothetical protein
MYVLIAFGNDLVQDATSHIIGHCASKRHVRASNFTAIWPGWVKQPRNGMLKALKAGGCAFWCASALTQFGYFLVQEGYISSGLARAAAANASLVD